MVFRRTAGKAAEPPVEPVAWTDVWEFVVSAVERPVTPKRRTATRGARAIRVPRGGKSDRVFAPCAYVASRQLTGLPAAPEPTLFEDAAQQRLLCYVAPAQEVDGERQPQGRRRAAERLLHGALDNMLSGPELSDRARGPRSLEWRSGEEIVMTSEGGAHVRIREDGRIAVSRSPSP